MSPLRAKAPRIREKRLDAIGAWLGSTSAAVAEFSGDEVVQRIRTFAQSTNDDLIYALRIAGTIRNSVTVVHAPRGCAAAGLAHALAGPGSVWASTNLDERDTIMGADGKLRKAVTSLHHRHRPDVVFIVASPVVAINNDDIQSVVEELREELELPIVPIYVTGFASRTAVTGYDTALHALVKYLAGSATAEEKGELVNLLSVAEHPADRSEAERLLRELGLAFVTTPDNADIRDFRRAIGARASIPLCPDAPEYLGHVLREKYGVPLIEAPRPVGISGTGAWLAAVGSALGLKKEAAALHARRKAETEQSLAGFSLAGTAVYLSLAAAHAFALLELVHELGGTVAGLTISHLDRLHLPHLRELAARLPDLQIHVANGQAFEEASIVRSINPGLYIGDGLHVPQIARLAVPAVSLEGTPVIGYGGVTGLVRKIRAALAFRSFGELLGRTPTPYHEAWFRRSQNWHIKQEVK